MFTSPGTSQGNFMDPEALANLKSVNLNADFAAVTLAMNGAFDARIAQLQKAKADYDAINAIKMTVAEAGKIMEKAKNEAKDVQDRLDAALSKEKELFYVGQKLGDKEAELNLRAASVEKSEAALEDREKKLKQDHDRLSQANLDALNDIKKRETAYLADRQNLEKMKKAFNAKLEALKE